jgi:hypothetical protein
MLHPTDLMHSIATDRQRAAQERAAARHARGRRRLGGPLRVRRSGVPRVALG